MLKKEFILAEHGHISVASFIARNSIVLIQRLVQLLQETMTQPDVTFEALICMQKLIVGLTYDEVEQVVNLNLVPATIALMQKKEPEM